MCPGTTYQYQVQVFSRNGTLSWSGAANASGQFSVPPSAVDGNTYTITARVKSCSKSLTARASDGMPGDTSEPANCLMQPINCYKINGLGDEALAWARDNQAALGGGIGGGCADAARHAYFNAIGAIEIGPQATQDFLDAHEYSNNNGCDDNNMDLSNNAVGRGLGQSCGNNRSCVQRAVADALKRGDLTVWSGGQTNSGTLVSSSVCRVTY